MIKSWKEALKLLEDGWIVMRSDGMKGVGSRGGGWTSVNHYRIFKGIMGKVEKSESLHHGTFKALKNRKLLKYISSTMDDTFWKLNIDLKKELKKG